MRSLLCFVAVFFCVHIVLAADTLRLQRASNNAIYVADASKSIPPGSVVQFEGDYLYVKVLNVKGTADSPITFINKGLVRIGGFKPYTFQIQGEHFIVNGSGDPNYKYGFQLNYDTTVIGASFCFCPDNSTDFEVHHLECMNAAEGILQNPKSGGPMNNVWYHHLYIHDLKSPTSDQPGRAEAFYLGNTSDTIPYHASYDFHNCRIEDCFMKDLTGDGIQVGHGDFIIRRDTVINFATAHVPMQDNGIQIGNCTSAIVDSVIINTGTGIGMQAFGTDSLVVTNCLFTNIYGQASQYEDVIYLNGKGPVPLNMRFENNTIANSTGRYGINNSTPSANTNGSVFINNFISGSYIKPYGIQPKDKWIMNMYVNKYNVPLIYPFALLSRIK